MKKLETLENDLFKDFKNDELTELNKIRGGAWVTGNGTDHIGRTEYEYQKFHNDLIMKPPY